MNTTEKIVESYFRICRNCFTMSDVKVHGGNNRQLDLVAFAIDGKLQLHIEIGVTHMRGFQPSIEKLEKRIRYKFFGEPRDRENKKRRKNSTKNHYQAIQNTYSRIGFSVAEVELVWVCWQYPKSNDLRERLESFFEVQGIHPRAVSLLSFRDEIIPELRKKVSTAHYNDDALRTLSLLRQCDRQVGAIREKNRQPHLRNEE